MQLPGKEELEREARAWDEGSMPATGWKDAPDAVPQAKAATAISIRLPAAMLDVLKAFAEREGVAYQALMKRWLDERIKEERRKLAPASSQASATLKAPDLREIKQAAEQLIEVIGKLDVHGDEPAAYPGKRV